MIIPFISSLSDDVINAVPQDAARRRSGARRDTVGNHPAGCAAGRPARHRFRRMLLAISRAIGETMIVVMAAGVAANLTANPFESVTTVTVQIVMLLVGDQEFDSAKTLAAFALGLVLFIITLGLNILALYVVNNIRNNMTDHRVRRLSGRTAETALSGGAPFPHAGMVAIAAAGLILVFLLGSIVYSSHCPPSPITT